MTTDDTEAGMVVAHGSWLMALGIGVGACVSESPLRSPRAGGRSWTHVRTEHFRIYSDLDRSEVQAIAEQLEQDLDALGQAMFANATPQNGTTDVVVFAKERDFHNFAPPQLAGVFYRRSRIDVEAPNLVVTSGDLDERTRTILLHELTHDLFARNFGAAPVWLSEGWAEYFSTLRIEDGRVWVGKAPPGTVFTSAGQPFLANHHGQTVLAIPTSQVTPPSQLLTMGRADFYRFIDKNDPESNEYVEQAGRYLGAWAFVHMLRNGEGEASRRFSVFLDLVRTSHVDTAWARAFDGMAPTALDRELRAFLQKSELTVLTMPYQNPTRRTHRHASELTDGEVHLLWARLFVHHMGTGSDSTPRAEAELNEALRSEPQLAEGYQLRGLLAQHQKRWDVAKRDLEQATLLAPQEPRFLFSRLMLEFHQQTFLNESDTIGLKPRFTRLAQIARSPEQRLLAASYLHHSGQRAAAMSLAENATLQDPTDPMVLDRYAALLEQDGKLEEALGVQRRALAFSYEDQGAVQHLEAHLRHLEERVNMNRPPAIETRPAGASSGAP